MPGLIVIVRHVSATLAVVAASAGCTAGTTAGTIRAATHARTPAVVTHARKLPGIYLGAMAGPWYGPSVRPTSVLLGADWNISKLRWTAWNSRRAVGRGFYDACTGPAGGPPCDKFWATITATDVQNHDGARYFAIMKIVGKQRQVKLVMNTKLGWWQQARPATG